MKHQRNKRLSRYALTTPEQYGNIPPNCKVIGYHNGQQFLELSSGAIYNRRPDGFMRYCSIQHFNQISHKLVSHPSELKHK